MEEVHRKREADRLADLDARLAAISDPAEDGRRGDGEKNPSGADDRRDADASGMLV